MLNRYCMLKRDYPLTQEVLRGVQNYLNVESNLGLCNVRNSWIQIGRKERKEKYYVCFCLPFSGTNGIIFPITYKLIYNTPLYL